MKIIQNLFTAAFLLSATGANAALVPALGGQAVNDTDLNIAWVANANLAASNTFGLAINVDLGPITGVNTYGGSYIYNDGTMTWGGALKWISAMNAANYLGYSDWRLPTVADTSTPGCNWAYSGTDCGYNVNTATGEMAHLFYDELGNNAYYDQAGVAPQPGWGLANTGPFSNLLSNNYYWSGTESAQFADMAWYFRFYDGDQNAYFKSVSYYALAVRSGQVDSVPVPASVWLLGSGLLGLIGMARRKAV